jgi:hypothetical protein
MRLENVAMALRPETNSQATRYTTLLGAGFVLAL